MKGNAYSAGAPTRTLIAIITISAQARLFSIPFLILWRIFVFFIVPVRLIALLCVMLRRAFKHLNRSRRDAVPFFDM